MSTRANVASAIASVGVLVLGWQIGTHGGSAVAAPVGGSTSRSTTSPTTKATVPSTTAPKTTAPKTTTSTTAPSATPGGVPGGRGSGRTSVTLRVPAGASGTFTGQAVMHRWGSVEVTVTLASGTIRGLNEVIDDDDDNHSARINSQAVPMLKQQIIAASGGGSVSTISGATYTTQAYLTSLQSALDQAG